MARNFWDPSDGYYGMFDVWSFAHSEAIVSSGLGGGSLIYANVLIRKPAEWFYETLPCGQARPWPVSRADLDPHYEQVEKVLRANPFPMDHSPYRETAKTVEFRNAARALGYEWSLPNLAISFASTAGATPIPAEPISEPFPNLHGKSRWTCQLCGECDIGCNYGSKNTLDFNYLTMAIRAGAEVLTCCEVRQLRPNHIGYEVDYVKHAPEDWEERPRDTSNLPLTTLHADRLVLAAGTLGSTYLLLKNRRSFPKMSNKLGSSYSTNGDLLTFALNCKTTESKSDLPKILEPSRGPVITSTIFMPLGKHGGFLLQDAGYPNFINWLLQTGDVPFQIIRTLRFAWRRVVQFLTREPQTEISEQIADLLGDGKLSASSMPLLGMGRDHPDAKMTLERGKDGVDYLQVGWNGLASKEYFESVNATSRKIAAGLGGHLVQNPETKYLSRLVTVHPLGGCPMGVDENEGVVNSWGEVFNYPGMYVADGSVMPGPVGTNPSLTIAALARRFARRIVESRAF